MSIYDFKVKAADGKEVSLAEYKGKVLIIIRLVSVVLLPNMRNWKSYTRNTGMKNLRYWLSHVINLASKSQELIKRFNPFAS